MKQIIYAILIMSFVGVVTTSCDDDEIYGKIYMEASGLYVENYGDSASTTFTQENLVSIYASTVPDGWSVEVSLARGTLDVTAPLESDDDYDLTGNLYLIGRTATGNTTSALVSLGIVDYVDLDDSRANSMIVTEADKYYTFAPIMGEDINTRLYPASVRLEWVTQNKSVTSARLMENGRIGFYVPEDSSDLDDDDDEEDVMPGNAVISAVDDDDEVLWSWHIWVADGYPTSVNIGGAEFMDRNLGATQNNADDDDEILDSYGLYYQWGRKDPFIYPSTYNAAGAVDAKIYSDDGTNAHQYVQTGVYTGNIDYSILNPMTFILGHNDSDRDWLYFGNHDSKLWNGTTKSIYDPSPKGWRVPTSAELSGFGDSVDEVGDYSATINGELLMAFGLRAYISGNIQNLSGDGSYSPWSGYYWSSDGTSSNQSFAYHFYLNNSDDTVTVDKSASCYRGNGMQIRPVRE